MCFEVCENFSLSEKAEQATGAETVVKGDTGFDESKIEAVAVDILRKYQKAFEELAR